MKISQEQEQQIINQNFEKLVFKTEFSKRYIKGMYMFDVTKQAKNVLGDELVESAWLNVHSVLDDENEDIRVTEGRNLFYISEVEECENLHLPFEGDIYITLTTGKIIKLWTSEWGGLDTHN